MGVGSFRSFGDKERIVTPRSVFKILAGAGAVTLGCLTSPPSAGATTSVTATRISGSNRYATAAAIAASTYTSAKAAVLTSGEAYPDALGATYLSGSGSVPLLTTASDSLSPEALNEMKTLGVSDVGIVGGTAAVSTNVENQLHQAGFVTSRIAGADRYQTAEQVAESLPPSGIGTYNGQRTALLVSGLSFADGMVGGPLSYAFHLPILLTDPNTLSPEAGQAMKNDGIQQVIIVGGTSSVSSGIQDQLTGYGVNVIRLAGSNRQQTAVAVAQFEISQTKFSVTHVNLATGADFSDALVGGTHAGTEGAPIVLTVDSNNIGPDTASFLQSESATLSSIDVFGGTAAVSDAAVQQAQSAAG